MGLTKHRQETVLEHVRRTIVIAPVLWSSAASFVDKNFNLTFHTIIESCYLNLVTTGELRCLLSTLVGPSERPCPLSCSWVRTSHLYRIRFGVSSNYCLCRSTSMIREKGRDVQHVLWQKPLHPQKNLKSNVTTQKRHQNFNHTTIADHLKTVSWGNESHPNGVVKSVYGIPTFPLTAKAV